ncbi:D-alanyl-D-alanine carboxypeptidase/D-alanyl-D-alanine-endopeptidase [Segetibacter sp. 3557_3]|uniref:D-alanyl-D-alanine carboxypeptidase/D-alanyl-D-alanine-endopeptidase n=1 Tax=Segetibacter sp. 3557_3 TaxID=2547429 RepID=UPI0014049053|nr:D-alanyl-D-alanine carboxypeptidase [Segetibacter sp. 3557_3]
MTRDKTLSSKILLAALLFALAGTLFSCSPNRFLHKKASAYLLNDSSFKGAHIGISVYDPSTRKYLYNHDGDKYFIPASNTKLFTCYAAMKYLGDSILAALYQENDDEVLLQATGDPTFLHPDFKRQPLMDYLKQDRITGVELYTPFASEPLGRGWAWDDYAEEYMAERDPFPMYGNIATFVFEGDSVHAVPQLLNQAIVGIPSAGQPWNISRNPGGHFFSVLNGQGTIAPRKTITLAMEKGAFASRYLADTIHKKVVRRTEALAEDGLKPLFSQPTDSLLSIMMHRSDNFFAEQTLLMVSQNRLGRMDDRKVIDTLLKTDYAGLPQSPKWMDGSGLSRYNLFTPQDFIWLLNKMKDDFGMERVKNILPTGGEGTLSSLYQAYNGRIYAKTGTLSNHVALSGIIFTRKNRPLIFSVLVNNQQVPASSIRRGIERLITSIIERY